MMRNSCTAAGTAAAAAVTATAVALATLAENGTALAQTGHPAGGARDLTPPLTLSSVKPLAEAPYEGTAENRREPTIRADSPAELSLRGMFFRNVRINKNVINDIGAHLHGIEPIGFDGEGRVMMSFFATSSDRFALRIPGTTGAMQPATLNVAS